MGIFDSIMKKVNQTKEEVERAQLEAENFSAQEICYRMRKIDSLLVLQGYGKVLQTKMVEMSPDQIIYLYRDAKQMRNTKALRVIMLELSRRGLAEKDENGNWHVNFR